MAPHAFICGCAATKFTSDETRFFSRSDPWGLIMFARNCETAGNIRALVDEFRTCVGRADAPVLIDQEGGRVQRLGPPNWPAYPPARAFGALHGKDPARGLEAVELAARLIAHDLMALGITVDCLPVLDVPAEGAHDIIGDRAFGETPGIVSAIGRAQAEALMSAGVLPVIKHIPGHGRAGADSHLSLPLVTTSAEDLERTDFVPFSALNDMPMAMTAHVVYSAFDADNPATLSPVMIRDVIRNRIGFDGLLMSDDLSMGALAGKMEARTAGAFAAGCDIALHCNGNLAEMETVAAETPELRGEGARRAEAALARIGAPMPFDVDKARARLAALMPESVSFNG